MQTNLRVAASLPDAVAEADLIVEAVLEQPDVTRATLAIGASASPSTPSNA